MKRTRSKKVSDIVIRKDDLKNIWSLLERQVNNRGKDSEADQGPTIKVSSADSITTETDSSAIFDNDIIDLKRTHALSFGYSNYRTHRSVSVDLRDGSNWYSDNSFSVSGDDPAWVDATFVELERIFDAINAQSTLLRRLRWLATTILAIPIGYAVTFVLDAITPGGGSEPYPQWVKFVWSHPPLLFSVRVLALILLGYLPSLMLVSWVLELWPLIEFDFGPERFKRKKQVRQRLAAVFAVVIIPVALLFFDKYVLR